MLKWVKTRGSKRWQKRLEEGGYLLLSKQGGKEDGPPLGQQMRDRVNKPLHHSKIKMEGGRGLISNEGLCSGSLANQKVMAYLVCQWSLYKHTAIDMIEYIIM